MEQESKSMEIQRWVFEGYFPAKMRPDCLGEYVLYADHAAALKAAQDAIDLEHRALLNANAALREDAERMRVMREALEAFMKLPHLFDDVCVSEKPDCKVCAAINSARAALASTAPVAEAGQKEGE